MSKNIQTTNTIDLKQARLVANFGEINRQWQQSDDLFNRLARRLQTTLELNNLLEIFMEEIGQILSFDTLIYSHHRPVEQFAFAKGQGGAHHCDYNLTLHDENLGQLQLKRRHRFVDEELTILEKLIGQLIFPLRNAWLYRDALNAALTDSSTGIGNKRAMYEELNRELEIARRHGEELSLIVCDLDHFKQVNDNYGHLFGDEVLAETARQLQDCVRRTDRCYRYGGEEFVILLPRTPAAEAEAVAERIREAVAATRFYSDKKLVNVTLSLGLATCRGEFDSQTLIRQADKALYAAKRNGRNRVCSESHTQQTEEGQDAQALEFRRA